MHIINVFSRKRVHSPTDQSSASSLTMVASPDGVQHEDVDFKRSLNSSSSNSAVRVWVRDNVKRKACNIKTMLMLHNNRKGSNRGRQASGSSPSVIITRPSIDSIDRESIPDTTLILSDQHQSKLEAVPESLLPLFNERCTPIFSDNTFWTTHAVSINRTIPPSGDGSSTPTTNTRPTIGKRTSSARDMQRRISQKIQQVLGDPTVIHRPRTKKRPSVQHLSHFVYHDLDSNNSSSPSTGQGNSSSSRDNRPTSTPATSDLTTLSPPSTFYYSSLGANSLELPSVWTGRINPLTDLSVERHQITYSDASIKTVEATATAKIFLETHFNAVLNSSQDRDIRRLKLHDRLREHRLPAYLCQRAHALLTCHETNHLRRERLQKTWQNSRRSTADTFLARFEVLKVLRKGSFGVVRLVRERYSDKSDNNSNHISDETQGSPIPDSMEALGAHSTTICSKLVQDGLQRTGRVFAMKVIRKSDMVRNCQEAHLRAERDFLVEAEGSRWIIPLLAAFQDDKFLYLVMDYCIGGDFLGLLIRLDILGEEVTKWYVAEMILCVEEAHRMKWIHRDVKPDNFLIGADGHLKISDFGLAFDGGWQHDQKYFQNQRHDLLEKLGIELKGDDLDQSEQQETDNSRRIAEVMRDQFQHHRKRPVHDEPSLGEPILDWRNRMQTRKLARSVVGTSQYMAPEIIRGDAYDGRCD